MYEPIQDGIGQCWVADNGMPLVDGQLAGGDGGTVTVTVLQHLQQIAPTFGVQLDQAPVVERGMEGFERGANLEKMGLKAQYTAELFFNNVSSPWASLPRYWRASAMAWGKR